MKILNTLLYNDRPILLIGKEKNIKYTYMLVDDKNDFYIRIAYEEAKIYSYINTDIELRDIFEDYKGIWDIVKLEYSYNKKSTSSYDSHIIEQGGFGKIPDKYLPKK